MCMNWKKKPNHKALWTKLLSLETGVWRTRKNNFHLYLLTSVLKTFFLLRIHNTLIKTLTHTSCSAQNNWASGKPQAIILQDVEMTQLMCTWSLLRAKRVHGPASASAHFILVTALWFKCCDSSHVKDEKAKKVQNMAADGGVRT